MIEIKVCPSTLAEGFDSYSPNARKVLFDGKVVTPYLTEPSPSTDSVEAKKYSRMSVGFHYQEYNSNLQ